MKELSAHRDVLEFLGQAEAEYALMGGHAVGLWAVHYRITSTPLLSKDLDLRGGKIIAVALQSHFGLRLYDWKNKQTEAPLLWAVGEGDNILAEVFPLVHGVESADERGHVFHLHHEELQLDLPVLDVITLLVAKVETYCDRPEENLRGERNDLEHLRLLQQCVPFYDQELRQKNTGVDADGEIKRLRRHLQDRLTKATAHPPLLELLQQIMELTK